MRAPPSSRFSYSVTAWPLSAATRAASMPAGPPPTTATLIGCRAGVIVELVLAAQRHVDRAPTVFATWSPRARHPSLQRMQGRISSGRASFALSGHCGSAQSGLPRPMKSPLPSSRMLSASAGRLMEPGGDHRDLCDLLERFAAQTLWASDMPMGLTSWMVV